MLVGNLLLNQGGFFTNWSEFLNRFTVYNVYNICILYNTVKLLVVPDKHVRENGNGNIIILECI